jgi:hypothetical protein
MLSSATARAVLRAAPAAGVVACSASAATPMHVKARRRPIGFDALAGAVGGFARHADF